MERAFILCVVMVLVNGAAEDMDEDMAELCKMLRENCIGETGTDIHKVEDVNKGADLTADLGCYIKCIMETAGMLTDGDVDLDAVLSVMPDTMRVKVEKPIRACGTIKGADDCETSFLTQQCWQRASKVDYYLV